MRDHRSGTAAQLKPSPEGIVFASGFNTSLRVDRGHLVVRTGSGRDNAEGRFAKITRPRLRRLIVFGRGGFTTFEALAWLDGVGASFVHLSGNGRVLATSARFGTNLPTLRRNQALASGSRVGVEVAGRIISKKLEGQTRVLGRIAGSGEVRRTIEACIEDVGGASNLDAIRIAESIAAARYWECWSDVEVRFPRAELTAVPQHWLRFGTRASAIANGPRLAVNPANAVVNYLYRLLEVETRLGLFVAGLDPGVAIVHLDQRGRDSLALDAMEAARPEVDAFALDLFEGQVFTRRDFTELASGHCRIGPDLARTLADTMPRWAAAIGPVVEEIAKMLLEASGSTERLATRLSQTNRSRGREGIRREERRHPRPPKVRLATVCERCGALIARAGRRLCEACLAADQAKRAERFGRAGREALARLRAERRDPAAAPEVRARMHATKERTLALDQTWNAAHRGEKPDGRAFLREIAPRLKDVPLLTLVQATGLSRSQCSQIRAGKKAPHARHWGALRALAGPR